VHTKVVWIARFRDDLSRDEVRRHWTEVHGAIGGTVPGMWRYVQNHVVDHLPGSTPADTDRFPFDGYSCGWWPDRASYDDAMRSAQWARMGEDAPHVFDRGFFWGMSAFVDEHVIRDGDEAPYKVAWVVSFREDVDAADAGAHWREVHGPLALDAPGIVRYVQNHAVQSVGPLDAEPPPLRFDGFSECWFEDRAACAEALASPAWEALRQDGRGIFDYRRLWGVVLEAREMATAGSSTSDRARGETAGG
jgi:uncharacterized protein (TIGR02118 family)